MILCLQTNKHHSGEDSSDTLSKSTAVNALVFWASALAIAARHMKLPQSAASLLSDLLELVYFHDTSVRSNGGAAKSEPTSASSLAGTIFPKMCYFANDAAANTRQLPSQLSRIEHSATTSMN